MSTIVTFRQTVRKDLRSVGRSQQQLAAAIGLNEQVLSRKLNRYGDNVLTAPEVIRIAITLAGWGALASRADAEALLESAGVFAHAVPASLWDEAPLSTLPVRHEHRAAAVVPATMRSAPTPRGWLPAPLTPLIGREHERRQVTDALQAARLVTLTGVGGAGKTRLALQVASDVAGAFADGAVFLDLSQVRDPALIAAAIAGACDLAEGARCEPVDIVLDGLRDRALLLVLDNLEQLVDGVAVLGRLLAAARQVRILATSRLPLHLYGEHTIRVPPLNLADGSALDGSEAVQLFLARAKATGWDQRDDPTAMPAIAEICTVLDGLPLAIELAAAQVRFYSPQQLLPLLRSRLDVLQGGPRDVPGRQRSLMATLDWSYALLSAPAQSLFACLGILPGRFDAAAAAAVSGESSGSRVRDLLGELTEHSLVEMDGGADLPMRQFQTVGEYAHARLVASGEEDAVYRRALRRCRTRSHEDGREA